jgi:uncharacterized membrane protein HdeD (DUF308 family)
MKLSDILGVIGLGIVGALLFFSAITKDYTMAIFFAIMILVIGVVAIIIENKTRSKNNW